MSSVSKIDRVQMIHPGSHLLRIFVRRAHSLAVPTTVSALV